MTDKVQKIREWISKTQDGLMDANGNFENQSEEGAFHILSNLDYYIDSLQEEPKECMYSKDNYTDEDRKVLCDGCKEGCKYNKKEEPQWLQELQSKIDSMSKEELQEVFKKYEKACNLKEEPVSEELEEAASSFAREDSKEICNPANFYYTVADKARIFKAGANWQKQQDQKTIELAEDHAMLAGMEKMKEQMMKDAVGGYVIEDTEEGNGDFLLSAEYIPASMGLKDRQKVKVIILKDE